jgi:predicted nucleic acid-binding protein
VSVLEDTSAFYALVDDRDPNHGRAREAVERLTATEDLVTHEYVVVETISRVQRRLGMEPLRRFVDDLLPIAEVAWVDPAMHAEAREALLASGSRTVSLVDRMSFLLMRRRGIGTAFAFDDDFAREGFATLPG